MPDFFHWFLAWFLAFVLSMLFTGCFFSCRLYPVAFWLLFFSHRSRFPQRFSAGAFFRSGPCLSFGFVSVVLSVFSRCLLASLFFFFHFFFLAQVAWRRRGGLGVGSQMGCCLGVCDILYIYIALGIDIIWKFFFSVSWKLFPLNFRVVGAEGGIAWKMALLKAKWRGKLSRNFYGTFSSYFFGHVGAGGPAVQINKHFFLKIFACWSVFAMIENRGKKQGFAPRSGDERNPKAKKTDVRRRIFLKSTGLSAQRARKKKAYICLEMGIVARRRRAFLFFGTDLAGPVRQEDV